MSPLARLAAALEAIARAEEPAPEDLEERIHCARLQAKRLAAVLELARPYLPERSYRRARARLSGAVRPLAASRDAHVLREHLGRRGPLAGDTAKVRARLEQALRKLPRPADWLPNSGAAPSLEDFAAPGLARSAGRARKAMRKALNKRRPPAFHRWRKWAKCLSLQLLALERAGLRVDRRASRGLDRLQHDLGEHHDLTMARKYARRHDAPGKVIRQLRRERSQIEDRIVKLGRRLFAAPRASAFAARQPRRRI